MENFQENANTGVSKFANAQLFNAVGKRSDKSDEETDIIIAETTTGSFKVMPGVAKQLGIKDGSFVTVQTVEVEGQVYVLMGKGKDGVPALDPETGNVMTDHRNRRVWAEEGFGALAVERVAGSNILQFSVASAWRDLGMKEEGDVKKVYKLGESITRNDIAMGNGEFLTTVLYELVHVRDETKQASNRTSKSDKGEDEANSVSQEIQSEQFEVKEASQDEDFNHGFEETEL